jgi:SAP domain
MDNFNWKNSKAHLLLLSKFIRAQEPKYFYNQDYWAKVLNESPENTINRFINENMLSSVDLNTLVSYKYKVTELKNLLKQHSLGVSGNKDELVQRLIDADKEGIEKLTSETKLLVCTQIGCRIADQYSTSEKEKRNNSEQKVIEYIEKRMFSEASVAVANFEAEQVFSRGMGIDWKHHAPNHDITILTFIYQEKPTILSKLDNDKLEPLRLAASLMFLWGINTSFKWLPSNFETGLTMDNDSAARMLLFNATNITNLKHYKDSGRKYVEVLGAPNSCTFCKNIAGKRYAINEAPTLPNPNCTHELGCRCVYLPCIDK